MIALKDCKAGFLYRVCARNILYGVFNGKDQFIGIREKFDYRYLDAEVHYEASRHFGTCRPMDEMGECPVSPLSTDLPGSVCGGCGRTLNKIGESPNISWEHADDNTPLCSGEWPTMRQNKELFNWLQEEEQKARERGDNKDHPQEG